MMEGAAAPSATARLVARFGAEDRLIWDHRLQEEFLLRRWKSRNLIKHKSYNEMQYAEYDKYAKYTQYCYMQNMRNIDPPLSIKTYSLSI